MSNHLEAKAFADAIIAELYLDRNIRQVVDLGLYKSTQNFCMMGCCKVNSNRVKLPLATNKSILYSDSLIAHIPEGSIMLPSILDKCVAKCEAAPKNESNLSVEVIEAMVKVVNEAAPANALRRAFQDMVLFTRTGAGYCPICEHKHVNDNTHFATVHEQCVRLHCRHSEQHCGKKTSLILGQIDPTHADGLIRAMVIPEVFEQQNITQRAAPPMNFDIAEGAAEAPDTLLIKSPMGTGKTKNQIQTFV
jgi:hypothetical protein